MRMMTTHDRGQDETCPWCGYKLDCATNVQDDVTTPPKPGDITLCLKCAMPGQFLAIGGVGKISDADIKAGLDDKAYATYVRARRALLEMDRTKVGGR